MFYELPGCALPDKAAMFPIAIFMEKAARTQAGFSTATHGSCNAQNMSQTDNAGYSTNEAAQKLGIGRTEIRLIDRAQ
jgi:hypothetical protein